MANLQQSSDPCPSEQMEQFRDELHVISRAYGLGAFDVRQSKCTESGEAVARCEQLAQHASVEMQEVYYASLLFQYNRYGDACARRALAANLEETRYLAGVVRRFGGAVII